MLVVVVEILGISAAAGCDGGDGGVIKFDSLTVSLFSTSWTFLRILKNDDIYRHVQINTKLFVLV